MKPITTDPIGELVLLARGAADANVDWRTRLRSEWVPTTMRSIARPALVAALSEWQGEPLVEGADLGAELEAAVTAAMADQGYD